MTKVIIGIQARSTSERLPGKSQMRISGRTLTDWVIKRCKGSASYINNSKKSDLRAEVVLLVPEGDPLKEVHEESITVLTGPEHDVLSRYMSLYKYADPDYVVRITGDCPLIPHFLITKHIVSAANYKYDYVSNADEEFRTHPDGWDCEVISRRLMHWLHVNAVTPPHREHVTSLIKERRPDWSRVANVVGYVDSSQLKISVDTEEDLEFVRMYQEILERKIKRAQEKGDGFFRL